MIARMWHGMVASGRAKDYHVFLNQTGLREYKETPGNKGVFLLTREEEGITHFYTLTLWRDTASIMNFAGKDYHKAKYYPDDKDFLLEFEPYVTHFDVLEKPEAI